MSLPEDGRKQPGRALARMTGLALLAAVSACTVRPLYSSAPLSANSTVGAPEELASIAIKPVETRYAQQVRNNLTFAFNGGRQRTSNPVYSLDLGVRESIQPAAVVQTATDQDQPTASTITMTSSYVLTDAKTGAIVSKGRRSVISQYDLPPQEFAAYRAQLDAENRAARELAEQLQLAIAQDLARR